MVAVHHPAAIAAQPGRIRRLQRRDDVVSPLGRVAHQRGGDHRFDAVKLLVHGGGRDPEFLLVPLIGGMHTRLDAQDHFAEQVRQSGEEQVLLVAPLGGVDKHLVDVNRIEQVLENPAGHHAQGPFGQKRLEDRREQHPCRPQERLTERVRLAKLSKIRRPSHVERAAPLWG
jgi:hypothetical protein